MNRKKSNREKLTESLDGIRMPEDLREKTRKAMREASPPYGHEEWSVVSGQWSVESGASEEVSAPSTKSRGFRRWAAAAAVLLAVAALGVGAYLLRGVLLPVTPAEQPAADTEEPGVTVTPWPSDERGSAIATDTPAITDDPFHGLQNSIEIGVILPTDLEPRWLQDEAAFMDAFQLPSNVGFTWQVMYSQGDPDTEKANIEALIDRGIKVLVLRPVDVFNTSEAVSAAHAAGVTVIAYDCPIFNTDAVDYYVGFDNVAVGEAQGRYLADRASGTGNPLYLYAGNIMDNSAYQFFEGAWSRLQPKIADGTFNIVNSSEAAALKDKPVLTHEEQERIFGQIATGWDPNEAKTLAEADLAVASDTDKGDVFILGPNDGTARAIADAFWDDPAITSYIITGQDAEMPSVQYIIDGKQSMTVLKDTRTMARDAAGLAVALLEGKPLDLAVYNNGVIDIPFLKSALVVVTKDNVREALIDTGFYEASDFIGL